MPRHTLKIERARYVLTLDGGRRIIQDATILVDGPRISQVGKAADLVDVPADRVIDGRHFVVTPGFVNGHMHISYAHAVRGIFLDDLGSPLPYVFRLQLAMTEEEEYHTTLLGLVELLRNGTVCFVDPGSTKFPDACLQAYEDAGIRVILGECVSDQEAPFPLPRYRTEEALARTASFVRKWDGRLQGRIRAWAMPFSPETCTVDLLRGTKRVADEHGTGLTLHHGSGDAARRASLAQHGLRPTEYLEANGILGPNVLLAHALGLDDVEVGCVARSGAAVTMCPVTAAKGARGVAQSGRMPELLQHGVRIALGSDSPNNSNHLDMVRTMNMAAIQYKDARQDMHQIPAEQALEMATLLGARAVGLGDHLGSIEPGKRADLILVRADAPHLLPGPDPWSTLVYAARGTDVELTMVDGRILVEQGVPVALDGAAIAAEARDCARLLMSRAGLL
jgi:5-methylthioadenosine/S-adenosylhomocysteine deaminase